MKVTFKQTLYNGWSFTIKTASFEATSNSFNTMQSARTAFRRVCNDLAGGNYDYEIVKAQPAGRGVVCTKCHGVNVQVLQSDKGARCECLACGHAGNNHPTTLEALNIWRVGS